VKTVKCAAGERFFFDGKFDVFYATEEGQKIPALDGIVSEISLDIYCRPISLCGASLLVK